MNKTLIITCMLIASITNGFAASKAAGGKRSAKKGRLSNPTDTKKQRTETNKKYLSDLEQRREANPNAEKTKQDVVDAQTLSLAKINMSAKDAKIIEKLVKFASGKNISSKHKKLAQSYILLLAESNLEFTAIKAEIVLDAVQKWGESEAVNLGKIFQKTQAEVKEGAEINETFKAILKELGIEDAFNNFC